MEGKPITIGRCGACKHRDNQGCCDVEKIRNPDAWAAWPNDDNPETKDALIYEYSEGGRFWVGPNFGCVHWEGKTE